MLLGHAFRSALVLRQDTQHEFGQLRFGGFGRGDDLVDVGRFEGIREAHVGDDREADRAQPAMRGDDDFGDRRHADAVRAHVAKHAILGPGFEVRSGDGDEDALVGDDVVLASLLEGDVDQCRIVRFAHVGKTGPKPIVVHTNQRVVAHHVDLVVDDHDVAEAVVRIQAADGIADNHQVAAHRFENANREGDLFEWVAFVLVKAAFHRHDRDVVQLAANEPAAMACGGRFRKVRDLGIVDRRFDFDVLDQATEAGAENDADLGRSRPLGANEISGFLDFVVEVKHEKRVWN
jgi:hypothetical protein